MSKYLKIRQFINKKKLNKKIIFSTVTAVATLLVVVFLFSQIKDLDKIALIKVYESRNLFLTDKRDSKIGWISDIHADRFKRRTIPSGTVYPRQYAEYLEKVFDELHQQGIGTVIASGDNTNSKDENYARDLRLIAARKNMKVLWVRGNHDDDKVMSVLGVGDKQYYWQDYGKTRLIVLNNGDNTESGYYFGKIDEEQLNWLKGALKTDKSVIISMHIPIFFENKLIDQYAELEKILHESGNVKLVLTGHYHVPSNNQYDGIGYYTQGALTYDGAKGAYAVVDTNDFSVKYLFAK